MIMNQATWVLLVVALICGGVAFFGKKNPIARRNYLNTGGMLLVFATAMAIVNYLIAM
jgi:hypothetical protein